MTALISLKNRIKEHRVVLAKDLIANELNPRLHPQAQKDTLLELYREIGFARSLLVFELPDGRLKLIDGHLRQELTPDALVTVEVLNLTEAEANMLLLSLDPLASLAQYDQDALQHLQSIIESDSEILNNFWSGLLQSQSRSDAADFSAGADTQIPEQFLVLVECQSEAEQTSLLERLQRDGITCRALVS